MAMKLNPYLTFDGRCEEAMQFYASVLGGEPEITTFRESGMDADGVMHASLETPAGFTLFASDSVEEMMPLTQGTNVQVSLSGDDEEQLRHYWQALVEGGQALVPLERQPWGDDYGMLSDRYGILWHVNIAPPAA